MELSFVLGSLCAVNSELSPVVYRSAVSEKERAEQAQLDETERNGPFGKCKFQTNRGISSETVRVFSPDVDVDAVDKRNGSPLQDTLRKESPRISRRAGAARERRYCACARP